MLNFTNPEFLQFRLLKSMNENEYLIHMYANIERLDYPMCRMTPFASLVVKSEINRNYLDRIPFLLNSEYLDVSNKKNLDLLITTLSSIHYRKLSTFEDDGTFGYYEKEAFPSEMFHTLLFVELEPYERSIFPELDLFMISQPIRGVLLPIKRSPCHKLYSGSLIIPPKIFPVMEEMDDGIEKVYYTKCVFAFVDIVAHFSFTEIRNIDSTERKMEDITRVYTASSCIPYTIRSTMNCVNYPERDGLMKPASQPLFNLSDIPKGISYSNDSVRTVLPSC